MPDEKDMFIRLLKQHGKNFPLIAQGLRRRSAEQCRNYFQNYKVKLNLNKYVLMYERQQQLS